MGKKYVIEIIEKPFKDDAGREVWRAKGFNTLYFDQNGLDKLEEYKEESAGHRFEVGDVCIPRTSNRKFIITKIHSDYYHYMWDDGSHDCVSKSIFEREVKFVHHSDYFEAFLAEGLK